MKNRKRAAPKRMWVILDLHDTCGGSMVEDVFPTKASAIEQAKSDLEHRYTAGPDLVVASYRLDPAGACTVRAPK